MSEEAKEKPRLTVRIRQDQYDELQARLPWGVLRPLFEIVIDDLIASLKRDGISVIARVLERKMAAKEIMPTLHSIGDRADG